MTELFQYTNEAAFAQLDAVTSDEQQFYGAPPLPQCASLR